LKAKAQKIGKKACVLLSSNDNHEENNGHSWAKKNSPGSVDLYAKCIKEGPVEWTKPERALEAAKNVWTKSKLRLVMLQLEPLFKSPALANPYGVALPPLFERYDQLHL